MGRPCETHVLGQNGKLVTKPPQRRRKFNPSQGPSTTSYQQLTPNMSESEVKFTGPDSTIVDHSMIDAAPESAPADLMELTVSFDDNDSISQDWFTPDWL
jgi:hypothetical protein